MKVYRGNAKPGEYGVTVDGQPLNPRLDLWNHSPDGFAWGYHGSGPAQLALAMLADFLGDDQRAVALHQPYKRRVIAQLNNMGNPLREWTITGEEIEQVLLEIAGQEEPKQEKKRTPLHESTTWPIVGAFALAMEETLDQPLNRAKGDREGWLKTNPLDPLEAIARAQKNLDRMRVLIAQKGAAGHVDESELRRRATNAANLTMIALDVCGGLIVGDDTYLFTQERAQRKAVAVGEMVGLVAHSAIGEIRDAVGAQKGQDTLDALEDYISRMREAVIQIARVWWTDAMGDLPGPALEQLLERLKGADPVPSVPRAPAQRDSSSESTAQDGGD